VAIAGRIAAMASLRSARRFAVLACVPVLMSGTCHFHIRTHHGHCHRKQTAAYEHPWVLREYRTDRVTTDDGGEFVRITPISRIDLGLELTGASDEVAALRDVTRELREVNEDLLGAPAGRLVFAGAEYGHDTVRVVWFQGFDGRPVQRCDGLQVFVLDGATGLLEIHNRLSPHEPR